VLTEANVYLVRSGPAWVLIDTAWPHRGQIIHAAAEPLFGTGTRPAAILLTHIHPDHAGSALELARMWDPPVHVHPGELPLAFRPVLAGVRQSARPPAHRPAAAADATPAVRGEPVT
jgi:glyoxylase-like metal-dependent hydrolase (beta-lactamase superfamily II)